MVKPWVKSKNVLTRKERRKEERRLKKARKQAYFSRRNGKPEPVDVNSVQRNENESKVVPVKKKSKAKPQKKTLTPEEIRRKQLKEENDREDKNIRMLEKQMKLNRRKRKTIPRSFVEDGLAYILEACDTETVKKLTPEVDLDDEMLNFGDNDDDLDDGVEKEETLTTNRNKKRTLNDLFNEEVSKVKRQKELKKVQWKEELESFEPMDTSNSKSNTEFVDSENEEAESDENDDDDDDEMDITSDNDNDDENNSKLWEDIYGRTRDKKGNIVATTEQKYIPPSKREENLDSEKLLRLKKKLNGLLNRLSEANVKPVSNEVEALYQTNSRNDMNETLSQLMFSAIVQSTLTPERLIQEHAMLIALLHANIGSEVGAHFLQNLVVKFDEMYKSDGSFESKELHNILLFLAYLYNFKIFHSTLMINILQHIAEKFDSRDLELILLLLKNIGFTLRKADPIALKEIILTLQSKANATLKEGENESRVRFMLETLLAIKNNNVNKIPNYDISHIEHLKKLLRGLLRQGCDLTELRISFEDLLNAETKGRWWIVGSSWNGEQFEIKKDARNKIQEADGFSEKILELARKQRMNTDVRRNIFCIIMTAEDCDDCFEKLMRLGLQNQQEREIVHVIIHCCMNEASFNRYYVLLATKFCKYDRRFQMTFQCTFWDQFKNLANLKEQQKSNLAQLLCSLLLTQSLCIALLKVIHFAEMEKHLVRFLKQLLLGILLHEPEEESQAVFQRISSSSKLRMLREGITLFLRHFVLRQSNLDGEKKRVLEYKINEVERILLTADLSVRL